MRSLPLFFRLRDRPVILLGAGEAAQAKRTLLERAGALIVGEEATAALAIVAIEDDELAVAAIDRLKRRGVLVNATDRPELCDFTMPAIIDRDPVQLAIGSDGTSAGLAKALRQRLERILPQTLGRLALALHDARPALRRRWPDAADRRRAIDAALTPGGALDPFAQPSPDAVTAWIAAPDDAAPRGLRVFRLASDDADQLTLEQARLLGQADLIVYSDQVSQDIVARGRADAQRLRGTRLPDTLPDGLTVQLLRE